MIYPFFKILFQIPLWFLMPDTAREELRKMEEELTPIDKVVGIDKFTD